MERRRVEIEIKRQQEEERKRRVEKDEKEKKEAKETQKEERQRRQAWAKSATVSNILLRTQLFLISSPLWNVDKHVFFFFSFSGFQ